MLHSIQRPIPPLHTCAHTHSRTGVRARRARRTERRAGAVGTGINQHDRSDPLPLSNTNRPTGHAKQITAQCAAAILSSCPLDIRPLMIWSFAIVQGSSLSIN